MDTSTINAAITAAIKANGNNEITGPVLQSILLQMVAALNGGKQDTLVSAENIKTVGGETLLGAGDVALHNTLDVNRIVAQADTTRAAIASLLQITETEVDALYGGEYDRLTYQNPDTGECFKIASEYTPDDHASTMFGLGGGLVLFYRDLSSTPGAYNIQISHL